MVLNDVRIKDLNLVRNATATSFRAASYDLTIGTIITPEGAAVYEHAIPPQGVVKVISNEIVHVPSNITGYVHVKTQLCNEGILTLNIGIVDPGFSGPLQSTVINFGKTLHRLHKGAVFGRITFHDQSAEGSNTPQISRSLEMVLQDAKSHVDRYLAKDFLDFTKTVKAAAHEAAGEYRNIILWFAPGLALLLATFTFFLNFSNMSRLESYINVKDRAADLKDREDLNAKLVELTTKNDALTVEVARLRAAVNQTSSDRLPTAAPTKSGQHE
jgi:deoxycytidine triphosphate deaminase